MGTDAGLIAGCIGDANTKLDEHKRKKEQAESNLSNAKWELSALRGAYNTWN